MFKKARAAIAALIGAGQKAVEQAVEPVKSSEDKLPDVKKVTTDYQYYRDLWANRKRRRGYSAKSPHWYRTAGYGPGEPCRRTRATGPTSYDEFKAEQAAQRAARKLAQ